ncbi:Beta-galactosidase 8 [Ranunculus cassubicifolius]
MPDSSNSNSESLSGKEKVDSAAFSALYLKDVSSLITPERLDGTNYVEWSLNAQNKIRGRKRWGFISGTKVAPKDTDSEEYEAWEDENCMVKSWLLDAMTKDIRSLFIRLSTAKEIWENVKQTYSVSQDASKGYQLYCEVISIRQNGGPVISYFGKLQKLWQELDAIENCTMECANDVKKYSTKVNSQRVYVFLAGLDSHLDGVRGRVLATVPLPNLQSVYAMVCSEANRQDAMLGGTSNEGTAMVARKSGFDSKKGIRKCTHCNGDNHVVDTCFKLHGYPDWHPKSKKVSPMGSASNLVNASGFIAKSEYSYQGEDWQW